MSLNNSKLRKKPNRNYTKSKLEKEYPYFSLPQFRNILNPIIAKVRGVDIIVAKNMKKLSPKEVDEFRKECDDLYEERLLV